jgi:hypothetical protein
MSAFTQHGTLPVTVVRRCDDEAHADAVTWRALGCLGERKYDLAFNNCEHFASWAYDGVKRSEQVESAAETAVTVAAAAAFVYSAYKGSKLALPMAAVAGLALINASASASASSSTDDATADRYRIERECDTGTPIGTDDSAAVEAAASSSAAASTSAPTDASPDGTAQASSSSSSATSTSRLAMAAAAAAGLFLAGKAAYNAYFGDAAADADARLDNFSSVCVIEPGASGNAGGGGASASGGASVGSSNAAPARAAAAGSSVEPGRGDLDSDVDPLAARVAELVALGFDDASAARTALEACGGDVHAAVLFLSQ